MRASEEHTITRLERMVARIRLPAVVRQVRRERLTYLSPLRLISLDRHARLAPAGHFIEAGVALGGSAVVLLAAMQDEREFHGYDVFGQIPPPGERDPDDAHERYAVIAGGDSTGIRGDSYYGYESDLYEKVAITLASYGYPVSDHVQLHKGLYEDTFHPPDPVALAHIDCDWYDSVLLCLERLSDRLAPGAYVVIDDYFDWEGCQRAVDEFRAHHPMEVATSRDHLVLKWPQ